MMLTMLTTNVKDKALVEVVISLLEPSHLDQQETRINNTIHERS